MSKKQDKNSKNLIRQQQKNRKPSSQLGKEQIMQTPAKKNEQKRQEQFLKLIEPLPIPPKINIPLTASSNGNYTYGHDMKVIQTPYTHQPRRFIHHEIEDMQNDLGPITNKIRWQQTPAKGYSSSSEQQQSSSNHQNNSGNNSPSNSREQSNNNQSEHQDQDQEVQKKSQQQHRRYSLQRNQRERQFTKRMLQQKKLLEQLALQQPNNGLGNKKVFCNCKKTKCLKLYCDCFRINQTCDGCNCDGCRNLEEYEEERNNAILVLMERNSDPFSQKINQDKHLKGCNCKKSFCLKKYCQCFQAGLGCGENCKCDQCKNGGGSEKRERDRLERQAVGGRQHAVSI